MVIREDGFKQEQIEIVRRKYYEMLSFRNTLSKTLKLIIYFGVILFPDTNNPFDISKRPI